MRDRIIRKSMQKVVPKRGSRSESYHKKWHNNVQTVNCGDSTIL